MNKSASQPQVKTTTTTAGSGSAATTPQQDDKALDDLLDFIEGKARASTNDKKKAKKERQKQQKAEEIRKKEEEERKRRQAEEAERKRRELAEQQRIEAERQAEKKRKKKEAQKLKKMAAKGLPVPEPTAPAPAFAQPPTIDLSKDPEVILEELKARHMRELKELQLQQQRQLEEEARKLKMSIAAAKNRKTVTLKTLSGQTETIPQHEYEEQKLFMKQINEHRKTTDAINNSKPLKRTEALQSKPGTQIKITRTPAGGVEFTTVPAGGDAADQPPAQPPQASVHPYMSEALMPQFPRQPDQPQQQQQSQQQQQRPHVPSKSGAPMVTIRRVENPAMGGEPTVTISMPAKENNKKKQNGGGGGDQLLYTLVNGQAMRTPHAPADLIPNAQLMDAGDKVSKSKKKKLRKQGKSVEEAESPAPSPRLQPRSMNMPMPTTAASGGVTVTRQANPGSFVHGANAAQSLASMRGGENRMPVQERAPLPLDESGKVDLNRLDLPPGISITRIQGENAGGRKYFPSAPSEYSGRDQSVLPLPGTLNPPPPPQPQQQQQHQMMSNTPGVMNNVDYKTMEGMPAGLNGPNVIVVDTSSLKTKEEEAKEKAAAEASSNKGKKNRKKNKNNSSATAGKINQDDNIAKSASVGGFPPAYMAPANAPQESNSLKSGPQVLIKNVNGKVTFTPVPGTGASPVNPADLKNNKAGAVVNNQNNRNGNGKQPPQQKQQKVHPQLRQVEAVQKSQSVPNVNGHFMQGTTGWDHHPQHQQHQNQISNGHHPGSGSGDQSTGNGRRKNSNNRREWRKTSFNSNDGDDPGEFVVNDN